jgi:hypothetical protein
VSYVCVRQLLSEACHDGDVCICTHLYPVEELGMVCHGLAHVPDYPRMLRHIETPPLSCLTNTAVLTHVSCSHAAPQQHLSLSLCAHAAPQQHLHLSLCAHAAPQQHHTLDSQRPFVYEAVALKEAKSVTGGAPLRAEDQEGITAYLENKVCVRVGDHYAYTRTAG